MIIQNFKFVLDNLYNIIEMKLKNFIFLIIVLIFLVIILIPVFAYFLKFQEIRNNILTEKKYELEFNEILLIDKFNKIHKIQFERDSTYTFNFWATWCKPCLEKLKQEKYNKANTYFITVEDSFTFNKFLKNNQYKINLYRTDSTNLPFKPKSIKIYPQTIVIKNDSIYKYNL